MGDLRAVPSGATPWEVLAAEAAALRRELTDLRSTALARAGVGGAMAVIAQTVLGAAANSISFTSIASTYESLLLIVNGRFANAVATGALSLRFNNDSGANYDASVIRVANTTVSGLNDPGATQMYIGRLPGSSATADLPGVLQIMIPGYARTVFKKALFSQSEQINTEAAAGMQTEWVSGVWRSTAAINRVDIGFGTGDMVASSVATLYGIKGA